MRKTITLKSALPVAAVSMALALGLSGCGQAQSSEPAAASSSQVSAAPLSLGDAWIKAADEGMTGIFGTLENTTDSDINLVEARFAGAETVQLHETVDDGSGAMTMQQKDGGFIIPAGGTYSLEPGGDHIMVMGLTQPIKPGEEIDLELVTADGQTIPTTAVAKEYSGAQETYAPGEAEGSSTGSSETSNQNMDMSEMGGGESGDK